MFSFIFYFIVIYALFLLYRLSTHLKVFYHEEKKKVDDPRRINLAIEARKYSRILFKADTLFIKKSAKFIIKKAIEKPVVTAGIIVAFVIIVIITVNINNSIAASKSIEDKAKDKLFLADLAYAQLQSEKAVNLANEALKINSTLYDAYLIKGYANFRMSKFDKALQDFRTFIEKEPKKAKDKKNNIVYFKLGVIHFNSEKYKESHEMLTRFLKTEIRHPSAENMLYNIGCYTNVTDVSPEAIKSQNRKVKTFEEYYVSGLKKIKQWKFLDASSDLKNFLYYCVVNAPKDRSKNGLIKKFPIEKLKEKASKFIEKTNTRKNNNVVQYISDTFDFCGEVKIKDQSCIIYSSQFYHDAVAKNLINKCLPLFKPETLYNGDKVIIFKNATVVIKEKEKFKKKVKIAASENTVIIVLGCDIANKIYGSRVEIPEGYNNSSFDSEQDRFLTRSKRNQIRFKRSPRYINRYASSYNSYNSGGYSSSSGSSYGGYKSSSFRGGGSSWGK
ncbi:hypothetical protein KAJ27_17835 [bacterium]|nr:hypothetical protein [bacterium]